MDGGNRNTCTRTCISPLLLNICYILTGIIGGKFLERGRIAKPKRIESEPTIHYLAEDLYVGSKVEFNNHSFLLIDADEYALRYIEKHNEQVWTMEFLSSVHAYTYHIAGIKQKNCHFFRKRAN